ncbi:PepSY-associated TM helix domain-containing protein [Mycobacterium sp. MS1601]|uniref:PepSY-associated TM helix domain-containing protein n=1 Tax=Mycobacterium sp. MS1601 TaxID=1936029 RepID=UPI0009FADC04|nr:PepSY domain-containing protein [Mycobacterium sp. MS1601]
MAIPEKTLPPPARTAHPLVMRLHFYAGVLVAPFILIAALTGALYALAPTIESVVYRDLLTVDPGGSPIPLAEQADAARTAFPELTMTGLRPAPTSTDSTRVYFSDPALGEDMLRAVFVDPYTGRVLGDEATWFGYLPLSTWLDGMHRHLNLGEPGRVYSELAASWLGVVALGGLYLWLVRRRRDKPTGRARTVSRHAGVGVWALVFMVFLSATGITWSTYAGAHVSDIRTALNWQRPQLDTSAGEHAGHQGHASAAATPADLDAVVAAAAEAGVAAPVEVTLPSEPGAAFSVTEIDEPWRLTTNVAAVDPVTSEVTAQIDYWRDYTVVAMLADWGIRMHMGFLFGVLNQVVLLGVAIAIVTVIVLGYRMWWQRRPTRGSGWAVGRPPPRGGLRRIHPAAAVALCLGAVLVGWFLPLLGISLVAFLLVDLVLAAVKRRRASRLS